MILRSRLIALDSSHLTQVAKDMHAVEPARRASASEFEKVLRETGSILVLCWHHFDELLRYPDDDGVQQRIAFMQSLPVVAWPASFENERVPGSILDILTHEARVAFSKPNASVMVLRDEIANGLFRLDTGRSAVSCFLEALPQIRAAFQHREERQAEIIAIDRVDFAKITDMPLDEFLNAKLRNPQDAERRFAAMQAALSQKIKTHGDKTISNADRSAREFIDSVRTLAGKIFSGPLKPAEAILAAHDIEPSDLGPTPRMGDILEMAAHHRKLRIANVYLRLDWKILKSRARCSRIPSQIIQSTLRQYRLDLEKWEGSELNDQYLACLSPYVDFTYVDKRTHEIFRRARQKSSEFAALTGTVNKASGYSEAVELLKQTIAA